jgi:diguanylate cyclase (GGDEF)-like protein
MNTMPFLRRPWALVVSIAVLSMSGIGAAAATATATAVSIQAAAEPIDPALDLRLNRLLRSAYDKPAQAAQALQAIRQDPKSARQASLILLTEGRLRVMASDTQAAELVADKLATDPRNPGRTLLLRAEIAERDGMTEQAASLAAAALAHLEQHCKRGDLVHSMAAQGCDFRSAWAVLRLQTRMHESRGTLPLAEASARYALELAQAGQDDYLTAMSMGSLAQLSQALDQPEQARRWLSQALQLAQGDAVTMTNVKGYESAVAWLRKDPVAQMQALEEGIGFATQADAIQRLAMLQSNLVDAYLRQNQPAKAMAMAQRALPAILTSGERRLERTLRHNLSVAFIQLGQFEQARREMARVETLRNGQQDQGIRVAELREQGEAWAAAGQAKEALAVYHEERRLTAEVHGRNRTASLLQLKVKYDSERKQRDLDLLTLDNSLKDRQLANADLTRQVGLAVAALLGLGLLLGGLMVRRVRAANQRLKVNEVLLRAQSERDPLTDLANRRHFMTVMEQQGQPYFNGSLLLVDIDHFKHVNDAHGHAAGDLVICEVARRISQAVRAEDLVVRWGGEEFLVFAPAVSPTQLTLLAERILSSVGAEPVSSSQLLRVTVSVGFAHFPLAPAELPLHWQQAVNWADMALYMAKARGRNRAMGIATVDANDSDALLQIEVDFDAACSAERVTLQQVLGPVQL